MKQIVVLVPVYRRPGRVQPLLESFRRSRPRSARLLFVVSSDDRQQREALGELEHLVIDRARTTGDWARKINFGYQQTTEPWLLCAADDVAFHPGWDQTLLAAAAKTGKRVLGTNDLNPYASKLGLYSPHPFVARSYVDQWGTIDGPGQVLCELYDHNYPDRELAETAIARNEWAFVAEAVIEHLHPGWTETQADSTYRLGSRQIRRDHKIYAARRSRWLKKQRPRSN